MDISTQYSVPLGLLLAFQLNWTETVVTLDTAGSVGGAGDVQDGGACVVQDELQVLNPRHLAARRTLAQFIERRLIARFDQPTFLDENRRIVHDGAINQFFHVLQFVEIVVQLAQ